MCCNSKCNILKILLVISIIIIFILAILFLFVNNNIGRNILVATASNGDNTRNTEML